MAQTTLGFGIGMNTQHWGSGPPPDIGILKFCFEFGNNLPEKTQ